MASTTEQLQCLGNDVQFRQRVRSLFLLEAGVVYNEAGATPNHAARALFASKLVQQPSIADTFAPSLAQRTNLIAANTTFNFNAARLEIDASDASIRSQIATDWNMFAGV